MLSKIMKQFRGLNVFIETSYAMDFGALVLPDGKYNEYLDKLAQTARSMFSPINVDRPRRVLLRCSTRFVNGSSLPKSRTIVVLLACVEHRPSG